MQSSSRIARGLFIVAAVLIAGFPILGTVARVVTDYMWYSDLGHSQVYMTRVWSALAVGAGAALLAFAVFYINLRVARAMAPRAVLTSVGDMPPQLEELVMQLRAKFSPYLDKALLWVSVAFALVLGASLAEQWETLRLALAAVPFGSTDPQFGRDVGFYVFSLPALRAIGNWLPSVLVLTLIATAIVHLLDGAIQPAARLKGFSPHVKGHLSVLLGMIVASKAFDYWLSIWELNLSPRGQVSGASYTDVHAQLPALRILIAIALISAFILLVNIRFKGWRLPAVALGIWVGASLLVGGVYPAIVQRFVVDPNEVEAEAPYIERNIASTREAFGLDEIEIRPFPAAETLTAQDVVDNRDTLENVRLWDPSIVRQSYQQLQAIRPYYDFADVDIDRYSVDGVERQVLVSAREMNSEQLAEQAKTWVNRHLVYTHGYGLAMSPVNAADTRGLPQFLIGDIPPKSSADVSISQPAIYFGEDTTDYVIVNTGIQEFDYPQGDQNAEATYVGKAGIKIGSVLGRMAFALRFGASQILFSDYITPDSRVLFARDISSRLERLAPWLWLDEDPYPVVADGRVVWVVDGYTWSDKYPYSEPVYGSMNYMRNSVKVVIDAYEGTTTIYAFDETDPVLKAWSTVYPDLITPGDQIPEAVRAHFRYPQGLFSVQAEVYKTYHMTNPRTFYNKEDSWELPGERDGTPMEPFYVLMRLPGEAKEDFQMIIPFTPRNRDNMIGWMAAKSDPADYGKRVVYTFPKDRVILGPKQVTSRINADDTISPQLSLWNQRGSNVIFGNQLVIPLKDSIVYIQPVYLQAEQTAIPQLTRVVVVYADKVEMAADLETALLQVFGERPAEEPTGEDGVVGPAADAATARSLFEKATAAQKAGDWAEYGRLIDELGAVLQELAGPSVDTTVAP